MTLILEAALAAAVLAAWSAWRRSKTLNRSLGEITRVAERLTGGSPGERLDLLAERMQAVFSELSRDRAQLATILSNIVEAVVAVDLAGRIVAVNPALCALFSVDQAGALEKPFLDVLRHPRLSELLTAVIKEGQGSVEEIAIFTPEEKLFEAHVVPLIQGSRNLGALLVLHDITRLRRLERMRRDFVANVSHELRTPLASIRGFAETLRDGAIEDKEHRLEFVEEIEKDAVRLTALVDDLLDLSAIESGHRQPIKTALSVLALAREAAASLKPFSQRRRIDVRFEEAADLPEIRADASQLKQVFTNLLNNAIKYNHEGGSITVSASAEKSLLRIFVKDTGYGIPQEDLPRIFERFYRVDKARSRELGGTGLGLSIVKHIVEIHGGTAGVESELDRGSTFFFTLPI